MPLSDFVRLDFIHPESPAYHELTRIIAQPDSPHKIMHLLHIAEEYINLGCYAVGFQLLEELVAVYDALKECDDFQAQFLQHAQTKKGPPFSPARILSNFIRIGQLDGAYAIYLRWYEPTLDQSRLSRQQFLNTYR